MPRFVEASDRAIITSPAQKRGVCVIMRVVFCVSAKYEETDINAMQDWRQESRVRFPLSTAEGQTLPGFDSHIILIH